MSIFQPTGIQLHLTTGHKPIFYQENSDIVATILEDLDGKIFARASLIIEGAYEVTAFPGSAIVGITVLTDPLPPSFLDREKASQTVITQISHETFQYRRLQAMTRVEGERSPTLSKLEFLGGECLYLVFSEVAASAMRERQGLTHLFTKPSLACRRLEGGFSLWNTAHIVSWSHYPKLEAPANSWPAEAISDLVHGDAKIVNQL